MQGSFLKIKRMTKSFIFEDIELCEGSKYFLCYTLTDLTTRLLLGDHHTCFMWNTRPLAIMPIHYRIQRTYHFDCNFNFNVDKFDYEIGSRCSIYILILFRVHVVEIHIHMSYTMLIWIMRDSIHVLLEMVSLSLFQISKYHHCLSNSFYITILKLIGQYFTVKTLI